MVQPAAAISFRRASAPGQSLAALAARCRILRDHGMPPERRYWHPEVGFNYRMTNLQAAVGVAQMRRIDDAQLLSGYRATLMSLELKRTNLLTKYQPTYPLVREVDKQIAGEGEQIKRENEQS